MFYVKIHEKDGRKVIAICDKEIFGKSFEDGSKRLEINDFYNGELVSKDDVKKYLKEDFLNLAGKNIVHLALELGVIDKENIISIKGVLHAQVFGLL